ncbi:helix-turn-helix domain-containing protein [Anaerotruncus rubiinfantis]|uniref:helix-turn-helix domain-containing protein n=1 Tax=Anaerotruncus rubiinfantis TaxID=1720200 RepID=UPI0034A271E2
MDDYIERLKVLRERRGLSQSEVAAILGTTQQVYSRYEQRINELPIRHLITLCRYYGVSADHILGLK